MSTLSLSNIFSNGVDSVASAVNTNFTELTSYLNSSVVHRDGSKALTDDLSMANNRVTNMATGTADGEAVTSGLLASYRDVGVWTAPSASRNYNTTVAFDAEVSDPLGMANLASDDETFTVTADGFYLLMIEYYGINQNGEFLTVRVNGEMKNTGFLQSWIDASSGSNYYWRQEYSFAVLEIGDEVTVTGGQSTAYTTYGARLAILKVAD